MYDQWYERVSKKCISEGMVVKDYGVLILCGVGIFSGVEFVCCFDDVSEDVIDVVKIVFVLEVVSIFELMSVLEYLKMEISKFVKYVDVIFVGMFFVLFQSLFKDELYYFILDWCNKYIV